MPRKKAGERILGPYEGSDGWRLVVVDASGERSSRVYPTRAQALADRRKLEAQVQQRSAMTVGDVLDAYELHQREKNKPKSATETMRRLRLFFPDHDAPIALITVKRAVELGAAFKARTNPTGKAISGDYYLNTRAQVITFGNWCVEKLKVIPMNPFTTIPSEGKRRHGKPQLRIDEARKWMAEARKLADRGEHGAIAAMMTLLLGMRCSEVVNCVVRDVDDDGHLLWIPESKTDAGRRKLRIPAGLRAYLLLLAKDRPPNALLFGVHWRDWPREWVQKICLKAKVPKVTAHGMRGLHATLAVDAGATGDFVASALGHESFTTTARSYAKRDAVRGAQQRKVDEVLAGGAQAEVNPEEQAAPTTAESQDEPAQADPGGAEDQAAGASERIVPESFRSPENDEGDDA